MNNISAEDCKDLFNDTFYLLSKKDIGIELKHFVVGTAPDAPSFLVNQEKLKQQLIERFSVFFDKNSLHGAEIVFLKSNYGNGKSHFLRKIDSFLSRYDNVSVKRVSLSQNKLELHSKILEGINQNIIKKCADFFISKALETKENIPSKSEIIQFLFENYDISIVLANLIYEISKGEDISSRIEAISILKNNYDSTYLKKFNISKKDLNADFYFKVIEIISIYLRDSDYYLVLMIDEFEHIHSWKESKAKNEVYKRLKKLMDDFEIYYNIFFLFAESVSDSDGDAIIEDSDDPAYVSRKKDLSLEIPGISSKKEIVELIEMIMVRYEKYYEVDFSGFKGEIINAICENENVKSNPIYRSYTKVIMKVLNDYKEKVLDSKLEPKESDFSNEKDNVFSNQNSITLSVDGQYSILPIENKNEHSKGQNADIFEQKWKTATSMTKKTILCNATKYIIERSSEQLIEVRLKQGMLLCKSNDKHIIYKIITTENPSNADFIKRYNEILSQKQQYNVSHVVILYPYKTGINNEVGVDHVIFYNVQEVPNILQKIYSENLSNQNIDVLSYLSLFEMRA